MADEKETTKQRKPTALKRHLQSEKNRLRNKSFKAKVRTAIRSAEAAKEAGDKSTSLNEVYSLMDKGVKKGIFTSNKADRVKSRLAVRIAK